MGSEGEPDLTRVVTRAGADFPTSGAKLDVVLVLDNDEEWRDVSSTEPSSLTQINAPTRPAPYAGN
jgi:hypothetical protein